MHISFSIESLLERVDLNSLRGLNPSTRIIIGTGISHEEVKKPLLDLGVAFRGEVISDLVGLALSLAGNSAQLLKTPERRRALEFILGQRGIVSRLPILRELKRREGFIGALDRSLQSGRMCTADWHESQVMDERLGSLGDSSERRQELMLLAHAFEAWMKERALWDEPLALSFAIGQLQSQGLPESLRSVERLICLARVPWIGRELAFLEELERHIHVEGMLWHTFDPTTDRNTVAVPEIERWHALDDAAEALADHLEQGRSEAWSKDIVIIPDDAPVRRSLMRVCRERAVCLNDPRDPTEWKRSETVKRELLPLRVCAGRYRVSDVMNWIGSLPHDLPRGRWLAEIYRCSVQGGSIESYRGPELSDLREKLQALEAKFGGRKTLNELRESLGPSSICGPIVESLSNEEALITERERRAPLLYWLHRIDERLKEQTASPELLRPKNGLKVVRLGQVPVESLPQGARVWLFCPPPLWHEGSPCGDYWYSDREREALSKDWIIETRERDAAERLNTLRLWGSLVKRSGGSMMIVDSAYDAIGNERESLVPMLCAYSDQAKAVESHRGAHPRWIASYGPFQEMESSRVRLNALSLPAKITASDLDQYSKCPFIGLMRAHWRLEDVREMSWDIPREQWGIILHQAVQCLMESRTPEGDYALSPESALDRVWPKTHIRGMFDSPRLTRRMREEAVKILRVFADAERVTYLRSGAQILALEPDERLALDFDGLTVSGRPDRIDLHSSGLQVIDYKSGSGQPKGRETLNKGLGLQMPFYAFAAEQKWRKPLAGTLYIELTRVGGRNTGLILSQTNGKAPGSLTRVHGNSASLIQSDPAEVWGTVRSHLFEVIRAIKAGEYDAAPRKDDLCKKCDYSLTCGAARAARV